MTITTTFRRVLGDVEHAAEAVVHFAEKEVTMSLPQAFSDAISRIRGALAAHSDQSTADAATISALQSANADLTAKVAAKDSQISDLTSQLSDATSQISDMENALLSVAPAA